MSISIVIKTDYFNSANTAITAKLQDAIHKSCLLVERDAKINCPVDTGHLRRSIVVKTGDLFGEVGTPTEYAPYVEYGTLKQSAQPYLAPALLSNKKAIEDAIKKAVGGGK